MAVRFPLPTVMQGSHKFSEVPQATIERSTFDRSHGHKLTFQAGLLVPVLVDEVLPGDTYNVRMTALVRLLSPLKPFMDNLYLDSFFFFVPYRLVWQNWQKFNGEQVNPGDSTSFTIPTFSVPFTPPVSSLADYFGCLSQGIGTIQTPNKVSCLPNRAFWLIYNQWFRDENLVNSRNGVGGSGAVGVGDGPDAATDWILPPPKRGKRHDYFTSCLPFLQKGVAQSVPLTGLATVKTQVADVFTGAQQQLHLLTTAGGAPATGKAAMINTGGVLGDSTLAATSDGTNLYPSNLVADLSAATAAFTINALRQAFQIQKLLERDARGGTRYTEIIKSHFGVTSPDARLQRPEYLGGGSTPIVVAPIVQTTQSGLTGGNTPFGNLGGTVAGVVQGHGFVKSFTEHGVIIGIVNVRADLTYQQGIERFWMRQTRYDFYWPALAHIGEQAVLNQEIYWDGTTANNAQDVGVFGYQERYAEYRYKPSRISGLFRSGAAGTLHIWHLSEDFGALPTLGQTFIEDQTSTILDRILAVPSEPDLYADCYFRMITARPMPVFGVPGLIDHF